MKFIYLFIHSFIRSFITPEGSHIKTYNTNTLHIE